MKEKIEYLINRLNELFPPKKSIDGDYEIVDDYDLPSVETFK